MKKTHLSLSSLVVKPLTKERWNDFQELFGENGACGGCWCMWWKLKRSEFDKQKGENNKESMKSIIFSGRIPGLLAYIESRAVGWCAIEPRENYPTLNRSRILKKIDDTSVWSITCFFIDKQFRKRGITGKLIEAVKIFVKQQGGKIIEGYPIDTAKKIIPPYLLG